MEVGKGRVVVLGEAPGARVAVVPAWQGRVMTSTVGGLAPPSYGWINRALPADRLDEYVDRVARNIAALPDGVIEAAKRALPAEHITDGLLRENEAWSARIASPAVRRLMGRGLRDGAQTPAGERDLEGLMRGAARR